MDIEYIVISSATIIVTIWKMWQKYAGYRFEKGLIKALKDKISIHEALERLKHKVKAPRVLLLYTIDSGGIPTGSKPVKITIFDEVPDSDIRSIKQDVRGLPTDKAYNKLILKILDKDSVFFLAKDLEDGILKTFYVAEDIKCAYVYKIGSTKDRFFYISIAWKKVIKPTQIHELALRITANEIMKVLK